MLLLMISLLTIMLILSYFLFDRDFMAPPTIVTLGFLFGSLCTLYNEVKWQIEFSIETVQVIVFGVGSFIIGGVIAVFLTAGVTQKKYQLPRKKIKAKAIEVDSIKTFIVIAFQLVTVLWTFIHLRRVTGASSWAGVVSTYRDLTGVNQDLDETSLNFPWLLRQFLEANSAFGFLYSYIVANNLAVKTKRKIRDWIPIFLCCLVTFLQGYRSGMLRYWIMLIVVLYIQKWRNIGWKKSTETKKMIKRIAGSVIVIALLFIVLRSIVGRSEFKQAEDPLGYLTHYGGSPIAALDLFLKDPTPPTDIWGKETFFHLNQVIGTWFKKPELHYIFYKEFRYSPNGMLIGNIYSALRPPYYDFGGLSGLVIYMLVFGCFFTLLYCGVRKKSKGKSAIDFGLLLYAYMAYTFFLYFYNLYNNFVSIGFLKQLIVWSVLRWFLVGCRVSFKGSKKRISSSKVISIRLCE